MCSSEAKPKFTRLRFQYEDDLALLKEFLNVNPIHNPHGWEIIQKNLLIVTGKSYLIKTLKSHLFKLLEAWLQKMKVDEIRYKKISIYSQLISQ